MAAWTRNRLSDLLGVPYPIVLGPFGGGGSTVPLTADVSNAGGLGSFGAHHLRPVQLDETLTELFAATDRPFAINLWVPLPGQPRGLDETTYAAALTRLLPWYERVGVEPPDRRPDALVPDFDAQVEVVLEHRPAVFSFVFGAPRPAVMEECRRRGIVTIGAATTLDEGLALEGTGVDAVVASGHEAGGHRPSFLGRAEDTLAAGPLTAALSSVLRVPVILAGGIADGRGIASALALGADGVQVGTAFLATAQSGVPDVHRELLYSDRARYTALTTAFTGRSARGIRNEFLDAFAAAEDAVPAFPQQSWLTAPIRAAAARRGDVELLPLWAGHGATLLRERRSAAELVEHLIRDTDRVLTELAGRPNSEDS